MTSENKTPRGFPKVRKGFSAFLSSEDASISRKALLGIGALGVAAGVAFSSDEDLADFIVPQTEGHSSGIGYNGQQGYHSSHSSHASHSSHSSHASGGG